MSVSIVVADDHLITLEGVVLGLKQNPNFKVAGIARDGKETLELCLSKVPDVLILDLNLPEMTGLQVMQSLQSAGLPTRILIMSSWESPVQVNHSLKSGAAGYVSKGSPLQTLYSAIETIMRGGRYLDPNLEASILSLKEMQFSLNSPTAVDEKDDLGLTHREQEILEIMAHRSYNRSKMSQTLGISNHTLNNHITSIFTKMGVNTRLEAIQEAKKLGLLDENKQ